MTIIKASKLARTTNSFPAEKSNVSGHEFHDNAADNPLLRPPLKWAGGKRWLVSHLKPIWQKHQDRRYVEPFCGGLAVALGLQPARALLNDVNPHLINFYRWVASPCQIRHLTLREQSVEPIS